MRSFYYGKGCMFVKKIDKKKLYMLFAVVLLIISIAGSAYAYYSASASATIGGTVSGSVNLDLKVEKVSTGATGNLIPVDNDTTTLTKAVIGYNNTSYDNSKRCIDKNGYTACQIYKITLTNKSSIVASVDGGVTLSGSNTPNIECAKMDDINTVTSNSSCKGNKTLAKKYELAANGSVIYYMMVYIKNIDGVQTDTGSFNGTVFFNVSNGNKIESDFSDKNIIDENAVDYITNLYTDSTKTTVTNNSITYQYDTTDNLMQDTAGNIRYYGASPNNYIYFNCESYPDTNCELWRIIGVFDGKVKIMRNSSIGSYSWDSSASDVNSGKGVNEWSQADLMKLLNPGYESESVGGSLYYNSGSGTCYRGQSNATGSCDFTSTGIKNSDTKEKIADVTYYTGGWNSNSIYSNAMYEKERGTTVISSPSDGITRTTIWPGKIAIPYPSDYGYAADLSSCQKQLISYNDSTCTSTNWMKSILGTGSWGRLLTPDSGAAFYAWIVDFTGSVSDAGSNGRTYSAAGVAPVLYLSSDEIIESGLGTSAEPFELG